MCLPSMGVNSSREPTPTSCCRPHRISRSNGACRPAADGKAARIIRYQPLSSEHDLLYLAWVAENRARVDRMSRGRLGYIHIPDMGDAGIREFIKWWYPQVRKEGLVVDDQGQRRR